MRLNYNLKHFEYGFRPQVTVDLLSRWIDAEVPRFDIILPKVLCLSLDPEGTMQFLEDLSKKLAHDNPRNISVSHEITECIGLTASWLFDKSIGILRDDWHRKGKRFLLRGRTSAHANVNNFLLGAGFLKQMGISPMQVGGRVDSRQNEKFLNFEKSGTKKDLAAKGIASAELADYFNRALKVRGLALTPPGYAKLVDAFGEIIGNAEEHAGPSAEWTVLGCFDIQEHLVSFSIHNSGISIYQSLSDGASTSRAVLTEIEGIIRANRPASEKVIDRLGSLFVPKKADEPIWNVMALQEGISSKRTEFGEGSTRGQGLMDVIEFFDELKDDMGFLNVISGNSYILIDFKYPIVKIHVGPNRELRRRICFNVSVDLHEKQDPEKVRHLKTTFPGTLISGSFKLSPTYVVKRLQNRRALNG